MDSDWTQSGSQMLTYYTGAGSRWYQAPPTVTQSNANTVRGYYYDGLGRPDGIFKGEWAGSFGWQNLPGTCKYYPDNTMLLPCDLSSLLQAFDGPNTTFALLGTNRHWRFIHAPGVDEPLMGFVRDPTVPTIVEETYYVTDGAGRQLATGKANGGSPLTSGWQMAGGARQAQTFDVERMNGANVPEIAYFRHRAYDARTGRWTQEDPIGLAGGFNLYAFNGNNPVAYTDPFGLSPDGGVAEGTIGAAAVLTGLFVAVVALSQGEELSDAISIGYSAGKDLVNSAIDGLANLFTTQAHAKQKTLSALWSSPGFVDG